MFKICLLMMMLLVWYGSLSKTYADDRCDEDATATEVCLACSRLMSEFNFGISVESCCLRGTTYAICETCLSEPDLCLQSDEEAASYEDKDEDFTSQKDDAEKNSEEFVDSEELRENDDITGTDKRFGTLFIGSRLGRDADMMDKRFGKLFVGSRYGRSNDKKEKRFGTLFIGSRYGRSMEDRDKRFGTLFMGSRYGRSYNRYPNSAFGRRYGKRDGPQKRFGRLFIGSARTRYG